MPATLSVYLLKDIEYTFNLIWEQVFDYPKIGVVTSLSKPTLLPQVLRLLAAVVFAGVAADAHFADRGSDGDTVLLVFDALVVFHGRSGLGFDIDAATFVAPAAVLEDGPGSEGSRADAVLAIGSAVIFLDDRVSLVGK